MKYIPGETLRRSGLASILILTVALLALTAPLYAKPVNKAKAERAVRRWLELDSQPFGGKPKHDISTSETFEDENGRTLFFVVYLQDGGYVIVAGDDLIEPIIAICSGDHFNISENDHFSQIVTNDLPKRIEWAQQQEQALKQKKAKGLAPTLHSSAKKKLAKWEILTADTEVPIVTSLSTISDVRVSPFVQSQWDQGSECGYCYNYYTPNHYPCGCVATAAAQLMRYHQYPDFAIGTRTYSITVNGSTQSATTRGGDGSGGAYQWSSMPLVPSCSNTEAQRQQIGALCYDIGVTVNMDYASGGSGASLATLSNQMQNVFGYSNSIFKYTESGITAIEKILNTNLDARLPVVLGISGGGAHAILTDGYGFQMSTPYHHLNLGWGGSYDAWYNLPNVGTSYNFDTFDQVVYNIFVDGNGEIISGRVTNSAGEPIANATVTAERTGQSFTAVTDAKGIYALVNVTSNTTYTVTASKPGLAGDSTSVTTERSLDWGTTGNVWGVNLSLNDMPSPPIAEDVTANCVADEQTTIVLQGTDEGLPNPPASLTYIVTSLPTFGRLLTAGNTIYQVPATVNPADLTYAANRCATGQDSFQYKVNDSGTPPQGGDSNIATVTINISDVSTQIVLFEEDFEGPTSNWTIIDGQADNNTWFLTTTVGTEYWQGTYMRVDSDAAGNVDMDEQLISPPIDCSNMQTVVLTFGHYFNYYQTEIGDVDISLDGVNWTNIARFTTRDVTETFNADITALAAGEPTVYIRWHYYNANYEWYWGIDNVQVHGNELPPIRWAGDFDADCGVDETDLIKIAYNWLRSDCTTLNNDCDGTDLAGDDGAINFSDYSALAENWLKGVDGI